ncbi:UNVERIFIED_CONTAM: SWI2/SNF2-containing protein [Hammondia hammondi]|eukprot:XP_008889536.1 SWI2/SNF2-containing protein [Hammondia hammondi]
MSARCVDWKRYLYTGGKSAAVQQVSGLPRIPRARKLADELLGLNDEEKPNEKQSAQDGEDEKPLTPGSARPSDRSRRLHAPCASQGSSPSQDQQRRLDQTRGREETDRDRERDRRLRERDWETERDIQRGPGRERGWGRDRMEARERSDGWSFSGLPSQRKEARGSQDGWRDRAQEGRFSPSPRTSPRPHDPRGADLGRASGTSIVETEHVSPSKSTERTGDDERSTVHRGERADEKDREAGKDTREDTRETRDERRTRAMPNTEKSGECVSAVETADKSLTASSHASSPSGSSSCRGETALRNSETQDTAKSGQVRELCRDDTAPGDASASFCSSPAGRLTCLHSSFSARPAKASFGEACRNFAHSNAPWAARQRLPPFASPSRSELQGEKRKTEEGEKRSTSPAGVKVKKARLEGENAPADGPSKAENVEPGTPGKAETCGVDTPEKGGDQRGAPSEASSPSVKRLRGKRRRLIRVGSPGSSDDEIPRPSLSLTLNGCPANSHRPLDASVDVCGNPETERPAACTDRGPQSAQKAHLSARGAAEKGRPSPEEVQVSSEADKTRNRVSGVSASSRLASPKAASLRGSLASGDARSRLQVEASESSSSSESSDEDDALEALQDCLRESTEMTSRLVHALGGAESRTQHDVAAKIGRGRCHVEKSFALPADLREHTSSVADRLKEYQQCGVHWLLTLHESNRNGILADEMGLGKTAQTCVFLNYLYQSGRLASPTIIAAPASLLDNWMHELEAWAPYLAPDRVLKYHGKQMERREMALQFLDALDSEEKVLVLVTSLNTLTSKWDVQYLKQIREVAYLVVDEAHSLKNKDSLVYRKLNRTLKCERRLLLTGSPIQNRTLELRNLLLFLMPSVFDGDSLDLALKAFYRQTRRQKAAEQRRQRRLASPTAGSARDSPKTADAHTTEASSELLQTEGHSASSPSPPSASSSSAAASSSVLAAEGETSARGECSPSLREGAAEREKGDACVRGNVAESRSLLDELTTGDFPSGLGAGQRLPLLEKKDKAALGKEEPCQQAAEVECLQRILSPFILRRLKNEVLGCLPKKKNVVLRCEMQCRQRELYIQEIRTWESELTRSLEKLTSELTGGLPPSPSSSSPSSSSPSSSASSSSASSSSASSSSASCSSEAETARSGASAVPEKEKLSSSESLGCGNSGGTSLSPDSSTAEKPQDGKKLVGEKGEKSKSTERVSSGVEEGESASPDAPVSCSGDSEEVHASEKGDRGALDWRADGAAVGDEGERTAGDNCEETRGEKGAKGEAAPASKKKFVNSLLARLRRICNHPVLMQGAYTNEQLEEIARHFWLRVDGFKGNPREKVDLEIRKWSDYEIHQAIQQQIAQGDSRLAHLLLPKEMIMDSAKIRKMIELVSEIKKKGEKALIFSQYTTYLDVVEESLTTFCGDIGKCRLDGSTAVEDRQTLVDDFSTNPDLTLFLLSTKAGGQGLNLTAARTVILMDQDWNPQNDRQAEDRVHRLGQTQDVTIYRLCCRGTVEESILKCCQAKLDLDVAFGGNSEVLQAAILQDSLSVLSREDALENSTA